MITFTQGDNAVLNLTATDGSGNPVNLTGASFTTLIKAQNTVVVSFPNSQHSIVSAVNGTYTLTLSAMDTASCGLGGNKEIITAIVQAGATVYFHGPNMLSVLPPVPLQ